MSLVGYYRDQISPAFAEILAPLADLLKKGTTKKQARSFMSLVGYYRDQISPAFAEILAPLADLLKKGKAERIQCRNEAQCEAQECAYSLLKEHLWQEPVLKLPDFSKPFMLWTDASGVSVAAVLLQENDGKLYPVGYASKKLNLTEARYPVIECLYPAGYASKKLNLTEVRYPIIQCLAVVWVSRV